MLPLRHIQRLAPTRVSRLRPRTLRHRHTPASGGFAPEAPERSVGPVELAVARYRITMSMVVDARDDRQAHEYAVKLAELLKTPFVRMAVADEGIRLSGDGQPVVHQPQREL